MDLDNNDVSVSIPLYDKCTIVTNCTVEILSNTETGEISVGWYRTDESEEFDI